MGAKMRTDLAASDSAMSSSRLTILLTRSPSPIEILNVVTEGPAIQPSTRELRPNSSRVPWSLAAVAASSSSLAKVPSNWSFLRRMESGGSW